MLNCSFSIMTLIYKGREKMSKLIYIRNRRDDREDVFTAHRILKVFEFLMSISFNNLRIVLFLCDDFDVQKQTGSFYSPQ